MEDIKVTWSNYVSIRNDKLVLVSRRITEGFYDRPQVVDAIIGTLLDITI